MVLDLIVLAVVGFCAFRGMRLGTLRSALQLVGLVAAYAAAFALGPRLAQPLAERFGTPPLLGSLLGGALLGLGVMLAASLLGLWLGGGRRRQRSAWDRLGGAALGTLPGVAIALPLCWLALLAGDLGAAASPLPRGEDSRLAPWARSALAAGAELALSDRGPAGVAAARAVAHPRETFERVERLAVHPRLRALGEDATFWEQVETGHLDAAIARPAFLQLSFDPSLRAELAQLGLVEGAAAEDARVFREQARAALAVVGPRLRAIREDPALERLSRDPALQQHAADGDLAALAAHPDVRAFVMRALAGPADPPPHSATPAGGR